MIIYIKETIDHIQKEVCSPNFKTYYQDTTICDVLGLLLAYHPK